MTSDSCLVVLSQTSCSEATTVAAASASIVVPISGGSWSSSNHNKRNKGMNPSWSRATATNTNRIKGDSAPSASSAAAGADAARSSASSSPCGETVGCTTKPSQFFTPTYADAAGGTSTSMRAITADTETDTARCIPKTPAELEGHREPHPKLLQQRPQSTQNYNHRQQLQESAQCQNHRSIPEKLSDYQRDRGESEQLNENDEDEYDDEGDDDVESADGDDDDSYLSDMSSSLSDRSAAGGAPLQPNIHSAGPNQVTATRPQQQQQKNVKSPPLALQFAATTVGPTPRFRGTDVPTTVALRPAMVTHEPVFSPGPSHAQLIGNSKQPSPQQQQGDVMAAEGTLPSSLSVRRPLHEMETLEDREYEVMVVSRRNKLILLSRLRETAPRGRLSLINLSRRQLGATDAELIGEAITFNPYLSVLKLSYNALGDEGLIHVVRALVPNGQHHRQLSVLDLGFNAIGDLGCEALSLHFLAGNYALQTLYLSGNQIRDEGALFLAGAIMRGSGMKRLHLSLNSVGSLGVKAISSAIAKNDCRLTAAASVGGDLSGVVAAAAKGSSTIVPTIQELHLGSISFESDGFIAIPSMILTNFSLRVLNISNNNIDDHDVMLLSQALTQNKVVPLESLDLSFNEVTCKGVECLMNSVWGSPTLRAIKLDNNRLQDRGAQLCAVVLTSISLSILDVSFNRITTTGVKALMKNISENSSLQQLGLCGIPIDLNASKAISFAMAYNMSLQTLRLDNCSTGYSTQRHIVAGIVSNRRSSLRVLTGFDVAPIAMTLGLPRLPEEWSNDQVLGFFRHMWHQWLIKTGRGSLEINEEAFRGPAPPAAVAQAAKIAFTALGGTPQRLFRTEQHERPIGERPPVESAKTALLERTESGTMCIPEFSDPSNLDVDDMIDNEDKMSSRAPAASAPSTVHSPMDNPERRSRLLQWIRLHFRSLGDVGRLPFNNADLWQLDQYYFSPPVVVQDVTADHPSTASPIGGGIGSGHDHHLPRATSVVAPPPTPATFGTNSSGNNNSSNKSASSSSSIGRAVSFQALGHALSVSSVLMLGGGAVSHKRRSGRLGEGHNDNNDDDDIHPFATEPASKRARPLKPRIAYYPRIMAKIESLGGRSMEQTLSLLRQLKYVESIFFAGANPYSEFNESEDEQKAHSDIEMILLDLL